MSREVTNFDSASVENLAPGDPSIMPLKERPAASAGKVTSADALFGLDDDDATDFHNVSAVSNLSSSYRGRMSNRPADIMFAEMRALNLRDEQTAALTPSPSMNQSCNPAKLGGFTFASTPVFIPRDDDEEALTVSPSVPDASKTTENPFASFTFSTPPKRDLAETISTAVSPTKIFGAFNTILKTAATDGGEEFVPTAEFNALVDLPDLTEVKTGEKHAEILFESKAKLFRRYTTVKKWEMRALGQMQVLKVGNILRLVMRREQNDEVCSNHQIFKTMTFSRNKIAGNSVKWAPKDFPECILVSELFVVRFKKDTVARKFHNIISEHQKQMLDNHTLSEGTQNRKEPAVKIDFDIRKTGVAAKFTPEDRNKLCFDVGEALSLDLSLDSSGFGDVFNPKAGSWQCKECHVRNDSVDEKCLFCETPKEGHTPVTSPSTLKAVDLITARSFLFGVSPVQSTSAPNKETDIALNVGGSLSIVFQPSATGVENRFPFNIMPKADAEEESNVGTGSPQHDNCDYEEEEANGDKEQKYQRSWLFNAPHLLEGELHRRNSFCLRFENSELAAQFVGSVKAALRRLEGGRCDHEESASDVESVSESKVSADDEQEARRLMLPPKFMEGKKLSTASKPESKLSPANKENESKSTFRFAAFGSGEAVTSAVLGDISNISFASLAANSYSVPFGKPKKKVDNSYANLGTGTPVFEAQFNKPSNDSDVKEGDGDHDGPIFSLPDKIVLQTAEDGEEIVFIERAEFYVYTNKKWKKRAVGKITLLHHAENNTYRLLLRCEATHLTVVNQPLTTDFQTIAMPGNAWMWTGINIDDGYELGNLAVSFTYKSSSQQFYAAIQNALAAMKNSPNNSRQDNNVSNDGDVDKVNSKYDYDDEWSVLFSCEGFLYAHDENGDWTEVCETGHTNIVYDYYSGGIMYTNANNKVLSNTPIAANTNLNRLPDSNGLDFQWRGVEGDGDDAKSTDLKLRVFTKEDADLFYAAYLEAHGYVQEDS